MAKKKYTDDEFLKHINEEIDRLKELNERPFDLGENNYNILTQQMETLNNLSSVGRPIDPRNQLQTQQQQKNSLKMNPGDQGTFQTDSLTPTINFISARREKKLLSRNKNAGIIIGADRPHSLASGKGGKGAAAANTIDIVAGRMSCKQPDISSGKIKAVDPNFACDASRIYVSQLTDVDLNFGIVPGISGRGDQIMGKPSPSRAAIGIKSDKVRVIGREGVKIVTGRSYAFTPGAETNSLGGDIARAAPIELIAGNVDGERNIWGGLFNMPQKVQNLQGLAYGENLNDCLIEIHESLDLLTGCVQRHSHLMGLLTSIISTTAWEPWRAAGGPLIGLFVKIFVNVALHHLRINSKLIRIGYLSPYGSKYIVSQNVFTT